MPAVAYQVGCFPGSAVLIADNLTKQGGPRVTIQNGHASEPLYVGGDLNDDVVDGRTGSATTVATGFRIAGGASATFVLGAGDKLYGRGGGTTVTVSVMVIRTSGLPGA